MKIDSWNVWMLAVAFAGMGLLVGCSNEPEAQVESVDEPNVAEASAEDAYPVDFCVVTGEKLGSMGEPHVIEHEGQVVKFCCSACTDDFEADPAGHIAKLDAAAE